MKGPSIIRVEEEGGDWHTLVELPRYLKQRAALKWPSVRDGSRGRPKGGPMRNLAAAMNISRSRLSHALTDAERDGALSSKYLERIAIAFGDSDLGEFMDHYCDWYRQFTTKEIDR